MDLFSSFLGDDYKVATQVDGYLDRMEKLLRVKKLAQESNEPQINEQMNEFLKAVLTISVKELNKAVEDYEKKPKEQL